MPIARWALLRRTGTRAGRRSTYCLGAEGYRLMAQDGLLLDEEEPFDVLRGRGGAIEVEAD